VCYEHIDRNFIMSTLGHDDIGVPLARLHELEVHWTHRRKVLVQNLLERPPALLHVSVKTSDQPQIGIGVHEHLNVALISHALIRKQKNALRHDHVPRRNVIDLGPATVRNEVVPRLGDRLSLSQRREIRGESLEIQ
jgi:hypothetical protein